MDKITASWSKISEDGVSAAINYFNSAIETIDKEFGEGYSKQHPELVSSFMNAAATEAQGTYIAKTIQELAEELSKSNKEIANRIFDICEAYKELNG